MDLWSTYTKKDAAVATISSIWGRFSRECRLPEPAEAPDTSTTQNTLPLTYFVREILRRSRTSCSTLQAALLYCARCKSAIYASMGQSPRNGQRDVLQWICSTEATQPHDSSFLPSLSSPSVPGTDAASRSVALESGRILACAQSTAPLLCGRRMFLAAIVVASKFLQDRTYSNRTWSKISGLSTREIEELERLFLRTIRYNLVVSETEWAQWVKELSSRWTRAMSAPLSVPTSAVETPADEDTKSQAHRPNSARLQRVTSENVIGQALQFDTSLREAHRPAHRLRQHASSTH